MSIDVKIIDWTTVLADWKDSEEEIWRSHYTERGYDSWWQWRKTYSAEFDLPARRWTEEIVEDPHDVIPAIKIGGYRGWKIYRPAGLEIATFADIARHIVAGELSILGELRIDVRTNEKVKNRAGNLHDTTLLVLRSGDFTVLLDGTHRAAAIAVEAIDDIKSSLKVTLRVCHFDDSERSLLEKFAKDRRYVVKKKND
ncbi:hypothetical protein HON52_01915 [Candidatus Uhrbacteria bacterium]|jgi:hypothetical protein|nr:hypothetical protein [Candidatus Uhrbacteria bacterium]